MIIFLEGIFCNMRINKKMIGSVFLVVILTFGLGFASYRLSSRSGQIYLYGEYHSDPAILSEEFELWNNYYHEKGMRYLFVEYPFFTSEFLNLWMKSDNDELLDWLWNEFAMGGAAAADENNKDFYKKIKETCPETVFVGTDVGHGYETIGKQYLTYLIEQGRKNSFNYRRAQEVMNQGEIFVEKELNEGMRESRTYRETKMVENFIWSVHQIGCEDIMGIYGSAHVITDEEEDDPFISYLRDVPTMATQLIQKYGNKIQREDLS